MRNAIHVTFSLLMWCLFGYYWYLVGSSQINRASWEAVGVLGGISLFGLVLTMWWIRHNKKLARRNRRNSAPPTKPETMDADYLGRPLEHPGLEVLKRARRVEVSVVPGDPDAADDLGRKVYALGGKDGR